MLFCIFFLFLCYRHCVFQLYRFQHLPYYRHPNVVSVVGFSLDQTALEKCYIIYDSNAQESVGRLLLNEDSRKALSANRRVEIMYDISLALTYLHQSDKSVPNRSKDICFHGDIKSDNIVLALDGTAMLLSCGLSNIALNSPLLQESNQMLGTKGYICPWYCQGGKGFRSECDIYSFGVVLLELLTGNVYPALQLDRYLTAKDSISILMDDADRDAGVGWLNVLGDLCSLTISCIDPHLVRRPSADSIRNTLSLILGKMD